MCLAAIKETAVELVTHPSSGRQSRPMLSFWFISLLQFVRSLSFVVQENDNYSPLVLFPFLISSRQSLHWIQFQRLFLWKIICSLPWQKWWGRDYSWLLFYQSWPSAKAKFIDCPIVIKGPVIATNLPVNFQTSNYFECYVKLFLPYDVDYVPVLI